MLLRKNGDVFMDKEAINGVDVESGGDLRVFEQQHGVYFDRSTDLDDELPEVIRDDRVLPPLVFWSAHESHHNYYTGSTNPEAQLISLPDTAANELLPVHSKRGGAKGKVDLKLLSGGGGSLSLGSGPRLRNIVDA